MTLNLNAGAILKQIDEKIELCEYTYKNISNNPFHQGMAEGLRIARELISNPKNE